MANFSVIGKVDKRILVLPLMRVCSIDGPTLLVSDDGNFRNLYHKDGDEGSISGVDIQISNSLDKMNLETNQENYKHILYVFSDPIPLEKKTELTILCNCYDRSFVKPKRRFIEEREDEIEVIFSSAYLKNIQNLLILKPEYYKYLVMTEEVKELIITKDMAICKLLTRLVSGYFNMSKPQFMKLLTRKKYETSIK
ncbi:hypothetical protein EDD66_101361 [Mobilisporobacter senegalensis]|uniref:Uncharacterized protein n=1 Tax=Mobilisporobacter senegalensis TaxID=1329262 RepID=A0A3N1XYQ9_9FIRM|nr:hypothetical protein [Mobilisporobacter senegalensis]ROR31743.1 hypothetical protein EDD66_101361 [Mobilisporobacter senegalensis]